MRAVQAVRRRSRFSAVRDLGDGLEGHDFTLWVTVEGEVRPETGMVLDLKALSHLVRTEVTLPLDRSRLDEVAWLSGLPATTENLAAAVWRRLAGRLPVGRLAEVELWEGTELAVRYRGEG